MNLTPLHARAMTEMDDHIWPEGLGPNFGNDAWVMMLGKTSSKPLKR